MSSPQITSMAAAIQRYFEIALYLLLATGFGALASTGNLDLPTEIFVSAALLLRGYLLWKQRRMIISESWTAILTVGYVAFYLADYFFLSGSFLQATVHLVLFVMVVRMFSAQRDRDYYFLAVLAFLMVLAAAVLTVHGIFLAAFAAFMLTAVVTFILMEMRSANANATTPSGVPGESRHQRHLGYSLMGASPIIVFFILLGAAGIFFVLPRVSSGYLTAYTPNNDISTGFSDLVQLGRIGQIQQSGAPVMHVQIDGAPSAYFDLKWRGISLNTFDGRTWSNPHEIHILPRSGDGSYHLRTASRRSGRNSSKEIHYRVLMEPIGTNVFFLTPTANVLDGDYRLVAANEGGDVFNLDAEHVVNTYRGVSDLSRPAAADLQLAYGPYPPDTLQDNLQLPRLDARIPQLAQQITDSLPSNYDRAVAIESYLRSNYGYTLQLSRTLPRDPLAEFLFVRKQGHCEYFASAMAVMLRTLHIPSRIVNGFRGGEYNDLSGQYLIRASDAHSWVEAYFPGYGWVSFDPTPAAPPQAQQWGRAALYLDALSSFWREWVVNYDSAHQVTLARDAAQGTGQWLTRMRLWGHRQYEALLGRARRTSTKVLREPKPWILNTALLLICFLTMANAKKLWQMLQTWRWASRPERAPAMAASIWYGRMVKRVSRRGWSKPAGQTPQEFANKIGDAGLRTRVENFTRSYESARFAESTEDAMRLPELYEEIVNSR